MSIEEEMKKQGMRMKEELVFKLKNFFQEKGEIYNIDMAFLYGSWCRGYPKEESDIDIAVVFNTIPPSEEGVFELITDISLAISQRLGKDVNIIPIYSDFRKPMLYYNAIILGEPLYLKDFDRYIIYRTEALFHMEDFSLFGIRWQIERARRNLETLRRA